MHYFIFIFCCYTVYFENNFITKATTATIAKIIIIPTQIPVLKTSPMNSHPLIVRGINNKSNIRDNLSMIFYLMYLISLCMTSVPKIK